MNPYVFIVGCARSGTTLLKRMVDAHPKIAITPETHWIPGRFKRRVGLTPEGFVTEKLIASLLSYYRFADLGIEREELEQLASNGKRTYAEFVGAVFDLYGAKRGKRLAGDKTGGYVFAIETLHGLWPSARFVHIIRDGRDVCLSALEWHRAEELSQLFRSWREDPVTAAALWWEWKVRFGREQGARLASELYYELRYEALVEHPERECRKLCAFLDLSYEAAMLRFHEGRTKLDPDLSSKDQWLPPTPGLRDWRTQMSAEDVERFEAASGALLEELGYPRGAPHLDAERIDRAAAVRRVFSEDLVARRRSLPEQWAA